MLVVAVTFILKDGMRDAFMPLMRENARLSLEREPGCRQFDVCEAPDRALEVFLYEVYDDDAAFKTHKTMPHFLEFDTRASKLVAEKTVRTYRLIDLGNLSDG